MKLEGKNILLISPESWDHIFVSKHHYASYLGKRGNRVFFLNPPSNINSCTETEYVNVYSIHYRGFLKGLRFLPSSVQNRVIKSKFEMLQRLCEVEFDLVWSFDNSVFYNFSALPKDLYSISHIVDLNQDFEFEKAAKTANLCLGVITKIVEKQRSYNSNSFLIEHGVQEVPQIISSVKLPGQNSLKSLYIGNLDMRFIDWKLLYRCALERSDIDFVFLGSDENKNSNEFKDKMKTIPHIYFLPQVSADKVFEYLAAADILLLAYTNQYYDEYASPHKMMEYLCSGKMIIASWTEEYKQLHNERLIFMSNSSEEYIARFAEIVSGLCEWNNAAKIKNRQEFALNNTYYKQIQKIENLLSQISYS